MSVIQSMNGELDVFRGDLPEGHLLQEELSDEAIHIRFGAALLEASVALEPFIQAYAARRRCDWRHQQRHGLGK